MSYVPKGLPCRSIPPLGQTACFCADYIFRPDLNRIKMKRTRKRPGMTTNVSPEDGSALPTLQSRLRHDAQRKRGNNG